MEILKQRILAQGINDFSFMIVNGKDAALYKDDLDDIVSFPVYQENSQTGEIWKTLDGGKDDFYIYDKCGRLVDYVPVRYVRNYSNRIKKALNNAYIGLSCNGSCEEPTTSVPTNKTTMSFVGEAVSSTIPVTEVMDDKEIRTTSGISATREVEVREMDDDEVKEKNNKKKDKN